MAADSAGVPSADTEPDARSRNWNTWLARLSLPAIMVVVYSFIHHVGIVAAALILVICVELVLYRFRSRRAMYACSLAVLLFTCVFTLGIVGHAESVAGEVTAMSTSSGGFGPDEHVVDVTYDEASGGKVMAVVRKGDFYRILEQQEEVDPCLVEVTYRTQSVLGVSSLPPVADAIDSRLVISDYREYLRGGVVGRVVCPLTLVLGALPLAYLIYRDRYNLFAGRTRR